MMTAVLKFILILNLVYQAKSSNFFDGEADESLRIISALCKRGIVVNKDELLVEVKHPGVITGVTVIDLRPDKWGEAEITDGGVGSNFVNIRMHVPYLRELNFFVEVYGIVPPGTKPIFVRGGWDHAYDIRKKKDYNEWEKIQKQWFIERPEIDEQLAISSMLSKAFGSKNSKKGGRKG